MFVNLAYFFKETCTFCLILCNFWSIYFFISFYWLVVCLTFFPPKTLRRFTVYSFEVWRIVITISLPVRSALALSQRHWWVVLLISFASSTSSVSAWFFYNSTAIQDCVIPSHCTQVVSLAIDFYFYSIMITRTW